jgi:hypothetical protein
MEKFKIFIEKLKVFIYAEDPGAANFLLPIIYKLNKLKIKTKVFAESQAKLIFKKNFINCNKISKKKINFSTAKIILIGTSENKKSLLRKIVEEGKKKYIPVFGIVDAAMNLQERFFINKKNRFIYLPDYLFVNDDYTKDQYIKIGIDRSRIYNFGSPHYQNIKNIYLNLKKNKKSKTRIKINNNINNKNFKIYSFVSEGLYKTQGSKKTRTERVLEQFIKIKKKIKNHPYLIFKPHPKDKKKDYKKYLKYFDAIFLKGNSIDLIHISDAIIGLTSMVMTEAVILGKPTFAIICDRKEKDWLPALRNNLLESVPLNNLFFNYKKLIKDETKFISKGNIIIKNSTKMIVNKIIKYIY